MTKRLVGPFQGLPHRLQPGHSSAKTTLVVYGHLVPIEDAVATDPARVDNTLDEETEETP